MSEYDETQHDPSWGRQWQPDDDRPETEGHKPLREVQKAYQKPEDAQRLADNFMDWVIEKQKNDDRNHNDSAKSNSDPDLGLN